jgi:hypothetical protein
MEGWKFLTQNAGYLLNQNSPNLGKYYIAYIGPRLRLEDVFTECRISLYL